MSGKKSTDITDSTLRISQAANLLGVSAMTLRRWEKSEYLKPLRFGPRRDRRYMKDEILKMMKK